MDNRTLVDILMKIVIKYGKIPVCTFDFPVRHVLTGDGKSISPELFFQTGKVCDVASSAYLPHSGKSRLGCEAGTVMKFVFIPFVYCWRAGT